ncbi:MAG: DUF2167 domain-containing protein [Gammaproteobacteria bacterium]
MKQHARVFLLAIGLSLWAISALAKPQQQPKLDWQVGPTVGAIGKKAKIQVPEGYLFLGSKDTRELMEMMENIPGDNEYVFAPEGGRWYAIFDFNPVGYVKDNETLDADSLLHSIRKRTLRGNDERRKRGWSTLTVLGWRFPPRYDRQSKLLEWAIMAKDDGSGDKVINYNTRLLGRSGVMNVVLVASPDKLTAAVAEFKKLVPGFHFVPGERYADYRKGDRVAEFGLGALIVGGAAAVATKKGLWGVIAGFFAAAWKFLLAAFAGAAAWFRGLFKKKA